MALVSVQSLSSYKASNLKKLVSSGLKLKPNGKTLFSFLEQMNLRVFN